VLYACLTKDPATPTYPMSSAVRLEMIRIGGGGCQKITAKRQVQTRPSSARPYCRCLPRPPRASRRGVGASLNGSVSRCVSRDFPDDDLWRTGEPHRLAHRRCKIARRRIEVLHSRRAERVNRE
jgi:hypothetical protein